LFRVEQAGSIIEEYPVVSYYSFLNDELKKMLVGWGKYALAKGLIVPGVVEFQLLDSKGALLDFWRINYEV
jgi:hypothetical protein